MATISSEVEIPARPADIEPYWSAISRKGGLSLSTLQRSINAKRTAQSRWAKRFQRYGPSGSRPPGVIRAEREALAAHRAQLQSTEQHT